MTLRLSAAGDRVRFDVRVVPRAARNGVAGVRDGALVVRVTAPPVEGAANAALVEVLAEALGVAKGEIAVERGRAARRKLVSAPAAATAALRRLAGAG